MRRMRSSRISQEASRVFGRNSSTNNRGSNIAGTTAATEAMSGQQPELRRSSRSSALARFAYAGGASAGAGPASPATKTERSITTTATMTATATKVSRRSAAASRTSTATTSSAAPALDIEDVIPDLEHADSGTAASSRKRRRITATAMAAVKAEAEVSDIKEEQAAVTSARRTRAVRGVVKKEEEEEDHIEFSAPLQLADNVDEEFAPSASDNETKPALPVRRKRSRERKPTRIARTTTATTATSSTTTSTTTTTTILPPARWEETYNLLHKFRTTPDSAASNAAVDTMGCERLALSTSSPRDQRFHTLIALMLSSQTKDTTNAAAMHRLHTELPAAPPTADNPSPEPGLNLENILAVEPDKLNELIWAVGFHNNKTKYIKSAALICRDTWDSDIPPTFEGLVSLPGVGPKMAHLTLSAAWGRTEGIGVDVHVHRITNMWGWTGRGGTKTPEETRKYLESWLPRDKWRDINWLLVGLGQTVCGPVTKKCGDCEIGLAGLCRAAIKGKVNAGRRARAEKKEEEDEEELVKSEGAKKEESGAEDDDVVVKEEHGEQAVAVPSLRRDGVKDEQGDGVTVVATVKKETDTTVVAGANTASIPAKAEEEEEKQQDVKTGAPLPPVGPFGIKREEGDRGALVEEGVKIKIEE